MRVFRPDDRRGPPRRALALARQTVNLARLPPGVARFYLRALRAAHREDDRWSLEVATRPRELQRLLGLSRGRIRAVEIGTGTAWTTAALVLADPRRRVLSIDPVIRPQRERYLELAGAARERIELRRGTGEDPPLAGDAGVDFLFIDGSHGREDTRRAFQTWRPALAAGAAVAFHDFGDPAYPGVADAVADLGLRGRVAGRCFLWVSS